MIKKIIEWKKSLENKRQESMQKVNWDLMRQEGKRRSDKQAKEY